MRLTVAQALVRFLDVQYTERDGVQQRLIAGCFGIFGHGNVAGVGQALLEQPDALPFYHARNEQAMVHTAVAYARQKQPAADARVHVVASARARPTWSPARRWRRSTGCPCCCCPATCSPPARRHRAAAARGPARTPTCRSTTRSARCRATGTGSSAPSSSCPRCSRPCAC